MITRQQLEQAFVELMDQLVRCHPFEDDVEATADTLRDPDGNPDDPVPEVIERARELVAWWRELKNPIRRDVLVTPIRYKEKPCVVCGSLTDRRRTVEDWAKQDQDIKEALTGTEEDRAEGFWCWEPEFPAAICGDCWCPK